MTLLPYITVSNWTHSVNQVIYYQPQDLKVTSCYTSKLPGYDWQILQGAAVEMMIPKSERKFQVQLLNF